MEKSRWSTEFEQHPFQALWSSLKENLESLEIDDQTVSTSVYELARLKKVISYLDVIISSIDPDMTPRSIWGNFHQQLTPCLENVNNYKANKNIQHINQANEHADNLLTYVRPYLVIPDKAVSALKKSADTYASELVKHVEAFRTKSASTIENINNNKSSSDASVTAIAENQKKIDAWLKVLFEGEGETPAIKLSIEQLLQKATEQQEKINKIHSDIFTSTPESKSLQERVATAVTEITAAQENMSGMRKSSEDQHKQLAQFYEKIFGIKDESGKVAGGLQQELENRLTQLSTFEQEQNVRHDALFLKIENLLPGAASAGLATAYRKLKESFNEPIKTYTKYFYGSLLLLIFGAFVMTISSVSLWPPAISFVNLPEWHEIFKALMYKAPFIAPVIWLAIFSGTRRSQYERLQQEYAHKEALASSYDSYKKQIQDLKGETEALQKELIAKAIEAIAYNASITLDGKHQEKMPFAQLIEQLGGLEQAQKLIAASTGK